MLFIVTAAIFCVSLICAEIYLSFDSKAAFYLTPLRAWELLFGALLALTFTPVSCSKTLRGVLGFVGLGLIVYGVAAYDEETWFPGLNAVPPCLGAALIIFSGAGEAGFVNRALGWRPLAFVGLVSYSFYLWHWPFLVLGRHGLGRDLSLAESLTVVAAAFLVSIASWRFVEQPFRSRASPSPGFPLGLKAATAGLALFALVGWFISAGDGFRSRFQHDVLAAFDASDSFSPSNKKCYSTGGRILPPLSECLGGLPSASGSQAVAVWGDSHAKHFFPGLSRVATDRGVAIRQITMPGCPPLLGVSVLQRQGVAKRRCARFNEAAIVEIIADRNIELVVLSARWAYYTETTRPAGDPGSDIFLVDDQDATKSQANSRRAFVAALRRTVDRLTEAGKKVLILEQIPDLGFDPPKCIARSRMRGLNEPCQTELGLVLKRMAYVDRVMAAMRERPNVHLFRSIDHLCNEAVCITEKDGRVIYRDEHHLTVEGSLYLAQFMTFPLSPSDPSASTRAEAARH